MNQLILFPLLFQKNSHLFDILIINKINTENYSIRESTNIISSFILQEHSLINSVHIKSDFGSSTISKLMDNTISEKVGIKDFIPYLLKLSSHQWKKSSYLLKNSSLYQSCPSIVVSIKVPVLSSKQPLTSSYGDEFFNR